MIWPHLYFDTLLSFLTFNLKFDKICSEVALRDDETTLRGWLRMLRRRIRQGASLKPLASPRKYSTPMASKEGLSEPLLRSEKQS